MKRIKEIVWVILGWLFGLSATQAQAPLWNVAITGTTHTISINRASINSKDTSLETGDIVAVFYNSSGALKCGGKLVWGVSDTIIVYGNDGTVDGYKPGESFKFKIWKQTRNCLADSVQGIFNTAVASDVVFTAGGSGEISYFNEYYYNAGFKKLNYCDNDGIIIPQVTFSNSDVKFSSTNTSFPIDQTTGQINLNKGYSGLINIKMASQYCLNANDQTLTIKPSPVLDIERVDLCDAVRLNVKNTSGTAEWSNSSVSNAIQLNADTKVWVKYLDNNTCSATDTLDIKIKKLEIESLDIEQLNADCYKEGEVNIKNIAVLNDIGGSEIKLKNLVTNEESYVTGFLKEGKYQLYVQDSRGCITTWKNEFTILKDCLNDNPVFSPNSDGKDDDFYIKYTGTVYVYDKTGQLKTKFTGPAYWNGTDQSGNKLPMGIYLMITGSEAKTITVLR